jgi:hypothetical protein
MAKSSRCGTSATESETELFTAWDDAQEADQILRDAMRAALKTISEQSPDLAAVREEAFRTAIYHQLVARLSGHVRKERKLAIKAFRGAGPSDLVVDRVPERRIAWLAETKWAHALPSKIFESVWDAIKLCLQIDEHKISRGWVITGAPAAAWDEAEGAELFDGGRVDTRHLWDQSLSPPRWPNYGETIGRDLVIGGNGNQPTRVPDHINVEAIDSISLAGHEPWTVRAVAVTPSDAWIEDFAPAPKFPSPMTKRWLQETVPTMADAEFEELLTYLQMKRWTSAELAERVLPLRRAR